MKPFLYYSCAIHGLILGTLLVMGTLLSKAPMSYYAVDLMSSLSSGGGGAFSSTSSPDAITAPAAPKVSLPKAMRTAPKVAKEEVASDQDTIRMLAKLKKKRLAQQKLEAEESDSRLPVVGERSGTSQGSGHGAGTNLGGGPGIMAATGTPFPFPWYLKAIADRLDQQWKPPQAYEPETECQVTFIINRTGQISGSTISKSSRDSLFDQLALRAVLFANPMPPLPHGFPDDTLKVHMKFVGKR